VLEHLEENRLVFFAVGRFEERAQDVQIGFAFEQPPGGVGVLGAVEGKPRLPVSS